MNGREDEYTFSVPYVDNSQVIVVAENSGIEQLGDLAGKTVGVQAASAALDLLQSEDEGGQKALADTFGSLNEFADYNTAFTELQAGALDALAIDVGVAKYQLNSRGEGFKILDETLNTEQYAIGFKKGNQELCDIVNKDLQELANEGKVAELANEYCLIETPGGVGYRAFMPSANLAALSLGSEVRVHTYTSVREDAILLFGFLQKQYYVIRAVNSCQRRRA